MHHSGSVLNMIVIKCMTARSLIVPLLHTEGEIVPENRIVTHTHARARVCLFYS